MESTAIVAEGSAHRARAPSLVLFFPFCSCARLHGLPVTAAAALEVALFQLPPFGRNLPRVCFCRVVFHAEDDFADLWVVLQDIWSWTPH